MARRRVHPRLLCSSHSRHCILFLLLHAQPDLQLLTGRSCVFYIPLEATSVFSSVHETQFSNVGNSSWPWNFVPDTGCSPFVTFHLRFTMSLMKSCCHKH